MTTVAKASPAECCTPLISIGMNPAEAEVTATLFKALSDPHRVRIVNLLAANKDPVCVCDLTEHIGLSQPTVSFHLKKLLDAGLLERDRRGTWAYYSVNKDALRRLTRVVSARAPRSAVPRAKALV